MSVLHHGPPSNATRASSARVSQLSSPSSLVSCPVFCPTSAGTEVPMAVDRCPLIAPVLGMTSPRLALPAKTLSMALEIRSESWPSSKMMAGGAGRKGRRIRLCRIIAQSPSSRSVITAIRRRSIRLRHPNDRLRRRVACVLND